jgi:FtsP/CotA-like multicopper oxidase with cupredoxin domain
MSWLRLVAAAASFAALVGPASAQVQTPLPGSSIPQFVQPLPLLSTAGGTINTVLGYQPGAGPGGVDMAGNLTVRGCEFDARVLPPGTPLVGNPTGVTRVWGYGVNTCPAAGTVVDTFTGPVIVAKKDVPTAVTWVNDLGSTATTGVLAVKRSTDQTIVWADPLGVGKAANCTGGAIPAFGSTCAKNYDGPFAMTPHLHGGEIPAVLDGGPDAWFTSDGLHQGSEYYTYAGGAGNQAIYRYPNTQQGGPLWFHDHVLGVTRLNVYAGLAGVYYLEDAQQALPGMPTSSIIPLVIQDRMFDTNGQLFFPAGSNMGVVAPNPNHPYWVPEFTGDALTVNGKAYPFLQVQAKRYRFLILNGSNARTYELSLQGGPSMWVIGNDGGLLDVPAKVTNLTVMPGERYEVVIDFAGVKGNLILRNAGRTPFPKGPPPKGAALTNVMQFRVTAGAVVDTSFNPATFVGTLRPMVRLTAPATGTLAAGVVANRTRQLTLNEVALPGATAIDPTTGLLTKYAGGPVMILVNNTPYVGSVRPDFKEIVNGGNRIFYSELPSEGETEVWEFVNTTADAHPIHLHLVQFQIVNRQPYQAGAYFGAYSAAFPGAVYVPGYGPPLNYLNGNARALGGNPDVTPFLQGAAQPPAPSEAGWKDTVVVLPGMVTRLAVRWAPTATAVGTLGAFPFDPQDGFAHGYVWHCHILDHEDNEMMRPLAVIGQTTVDATGAVVGIQRALIKGRDY